MKVIVQADVLPLRKIDIFKAPLAKMEKAIFFNKEKQILVTWKEKTII